MSTAPVAPAATATAVPPPGTTAPASETAAARFAREHLTADFWRRALLPAAGAVGAALVLGLLATVLVLVTLAVSNGSSGNPLLDGPYAPGIWPLWIALAGLVLFGEVGASVSSSGSVFGQDLSSASLGGSLVVTPLLLSGVALIVVAAIAWRTAPERAASWRFRLLEAGVAGLAAAIVMTILALAGSYRTSALSIQVVANTAGVRLFLGALIGTALATYAGGALAAARPGRRDFGAFAQALVRTPARLPARAQLVVLPALVAAACGLIAGLLGLVIAAAFNGQVVTALLTSPLWVGTAAVWVLALGRFGAISTDVGGSGSLGSGGLAQAVSVFSGQSPWLWLTVVVALVVLVLQAIVIRRILDRAAGPAPLWLAPVVAAVGWLVLPLLLARFEVRSNGGISAFAFAGNASIGVAPWFFLLAAVWAFAAELLARVVLPAWTSGRNDASRGRTRLTSALVLVGLIGVAGIVVVIGLLNSLLFSPDAAVRGYLGHISSGDVSAARADVAGAPAVQGGPRDSADRIQDAHILSSSTTGSSSTASVQYTVGGKPFTRSLEAVRTGKAWLFFDRWQVTTPLTQTLSVDSNLASDVTIDGQKLPSGGTVTVFPGRYHLALPAASAPYVQLSDAYVTVGDRAVSVSEQPSERLSEEVQGQVKSALDQCAQSTEAAPTACPFSVSLYSDYADLSWNIDSYPTVALDDSGTSFSSTACGSATATFSQTDYFGDTTSGSQSDSCFDVSGTYALDGGRVTVALQ